MRRFIHEERVMRHRLLLRVLLHDPDLTELVQLVLLNSTHSFVVLLLRGSLPQFARTHRVRHLTLLGFRILN